MLVRIFSSRSRRGAQGEAALLVVFVIVFSDSDRVGRGEWSRVYDACMVVRVYLSGLRAPCMPRRCLRRLETRHPYHLGGVFWYGSSISIIIYLSLIRDLQRSLRRRLMLGSAAASGRIADSPALAVSFLYRLFVGVPSQER